VKPGWRDDEHVARVPEVRTLHRDLEAAVPGIPELARIGFHSLRRTTNTGMKDLGVSVATRKEVMRHATIDLTTSQSYTTIWENDLLTAYDLLEAAVLAPRTKAGAGGAGAAPEQGRGAG
jgi:integrase